MAPRTRPWREDAARETSEQQNPRRREVAGSIPVFAFEAQEKALLYSLYGHIQILDSRVMKKSRDEKLQQLSQMPA